MDEEAKERYRERARIIQERVPILELLDYYGYRVHTGYDVEQQFSCDLHGDGSDNKPSARAYPETASWHCFACRRSRDVIRTVQDKEDLTFSEACYKLEEMYGIPHPQWRPSDGEYSYKSDPRDAVTVKPAPVYPEEMRQVATLLEDMTREKRVPMKLCLVLWDAFDNITWHVAREKMTETQGRNRLSLLRQKVIEVTIQSLKEEETCQESNLSR